MQNFLRLLFRNFGYRLIKIKITFLIMFLRKRNSLLIKVFQAQITSKMIYVKYCGKGIASFVLKRLQSYQIKNAIARLIVLIGFVQTAMKILRINLTGKLMKCKIFRMKALHL